MPIPCDKGIEFRERLQIFPFFLAACVHDCHRYQRIRAAYWYPSRKYRSPNE